MFVVPCYLAVGYNSFALNQWRVLMHVLHVLNQGMVLDPSLDFNTWCFALCLDNVSSCINAKHRHAFHIKLEPHCQLACHNRLV